MPAPRGCAHLPLSPPRPARVRPYTSLLRLHGYLRPYLSRWVTMLVVSLLGTGATIVVPLVTKAVIDGPIADRDERGLFTLGAFAVALGVVEAVLMFVRRWVVARATLGVESAIRMDLYAHLQRLPMGFHGQWQSGQLLSRVMNDLSTVRRFLGFGLLFLVLNVLQVGVVTAILLTMFWPLGLVVLGASVPVVLLVLRNERLFTRLSREVQDQTGDLATSVEEGAHGLRVIKAFGRADARLRPLRRAGAAAAGHLAGEGPGLGAVLDVPRGHPERRADHRARLRRDRRRPGPADHGHARRLHHADAVPRVAGGLARVPAVHDAGGDDGRRPDHRGARHRARRARR